MKNKNIVNCNEIIKGLNEGDIVEVIADRSSGILSFCVNDINCGFASSELPKEETLYPIVILFEQDLSVEIV